MIINQLSISLLIQFFYKQTKHIEVGYHFVHDVILVKLVIVPFIRSVNQITNIFIKALSIQSF